MAYLRGNTSTLEASDTLGGPGLKPHIVPNVLYPAVANVMLDGSTALSAVTTGPNSSTVTSSKYGTVQSDGRMYYYTDIKGSKSIKDPRIGAHFGSQRHKVKSIQRLEQETATHGKGVFSIDGREWMRYVAEAVRAEYGIVNDIDGCKLVTSSSAAGKDEFIEIVGYFIDANIVASRYAAITAGNFRWKIDGGSETQNTEVQSTVATPLGDRYVDEGSLFNIGCGATLGIHTLKIRPTNAADNAAQVIRISSIELIAQDKFTDATCDYNDDPTIAHDANVRILAGMTVTGTGIPTNATVASVTSSTAFELSAATTTGSVTNGTLTFGTNNLQIPSQNVVSFGKKFTVTDNPHYDPFNGFVNDTSLFSDFVDIATSLGLGTGTLWGAAWDKGSSNHIRPYNGGRVVKWVDSSGAIKTSVNMMPANAQNVALEPAAEITTPSATNTHLPAMSNDAIDHSLAEVAKTFMMEEFGNGGANGNASYKDWSVHRVTTATNIAYVMDDGLTSFSGKEVKWNGNWFTEGQSCPFQLCFIGTGFSILNTLASGAGLPSQTLVQNLPYGTHILRMAPYAAYGATHGEDFIVTLDGVVIAPQLQNAAAYTVPYLGTHDLSFHQPKRPPIPENAVVLADYMLMADFVKQTACAATEISKGVRYCNGSRDHFANAASAFYQNVRVLSHLNQFGLDGGQTPGSTNTGYWQLPFFGTTALAIMYGSEVAHTMELGGSAATETALDRSGDPWGDMMSIAESVTLGQTVIKTTLLTGGYSCFGHLVATPIHTSSHYQTFETSFLDELVGGDRNMEQTNLVVTPDGKTWDEVTRDTSYIGNLVWNVQDNVATSAGAAVNFTDYRGQLVGEDMAQKDFAIYYGGLGAVCLKEGSYNIVAIGVARVASSNEDTVQIWVNGTLISKGTAAGSGYSQVHATSILQLYRGDYVQIKGGLYGEAGYTSFSIIRQPDIKRIKDNEPARTMSRERTENRWAATR